MQNSIVDHRKPKILKQQLMPSTGTVKGKDVFEDNTALH